MTDEHSSIFLADDGRYFYRVDTDEVWDAPTNRAPVHQWTDGETMTERSASNWPQGVRGRMLTPQEEYQHEVGLWHRSEQHLSDALRAMGLSPDALKTTTKA
jgi:hypothetical protein